MKEKDFTRYLAPQVEIAEISVEAGFALTPIGGGASLSPFTPDGTPI